MPHHLGSAGDMLKVKIFRGGNLDIYMSITVMGNKRYGLDIA
jgi:hypothetical protein